MELHIFKDKDSLTHAAAEWITELIASKLKSEPRFTWLLSGGSTPKGLYQLMSAEPFRNRIDWSKVHIFFGDERVVPFEDDRNNGKMANDTLLNHVPIPRNQIHFIETDIDPEISSTEYENVLHEYFDQNPSTFDLALLGMGDDAHTLSVFPGSNLLAENEKWVTSLYVPDLEMNRITLMPSIVNRSENVMFLVTGESKANALKHVLKDSYAPSKYPAQLIQPRHGELHWFVDEGAGKELS